MRKPMTVVGILAVATGAAWGCSSSESAASSGASCETARREACVQAFACSEGKAIKGDGSSSYATVAECQAVAPSECAAATSFFKAAGLVEPNWDACTKAIQTGAGTCAPSVAGPKNYTMPKPVCSATDPLAKADGGADAGAVAQCSDRLAPAVVRLPGVYWLEDINLGDIDSNGTADASAWKRIGYNLDGLCTTQNSKDACVPAAGGPPVRDGDAPGFSGLDNSFGQHFVPLLGIAIPNISVESRKGPNLIEITGDHNDALYLAAFGYNPIHIDGTWLDTGGAATTLTGTVSEAALLAPFEGVPGKSCQRQQEFVSTLKAALSSYTDSFVGGSYNAPGTCNALSLGIEFRRAVPYAGGIPLPEPFDLCK